MKVSVVVAGLVWPVLAFGQQLYTNADLAKFDVPGAYSNQDLRRLPPLAVQKQAAFTLPPYVSPQTSGEARLQESYDFLKSTRDSFACELDFELRRVDFSRSAFAGDTQGYSIRLGYGARVGGLIRELEKRVALLDCQMDDLVDRARRAGLTIDKR